MKYHFRFYRDENGRLRAECVETGFRKPVERRDGKRYKFPKVFRFWPKDGDTFLRLQTAQEGDTVEAEGRFT